MTPYEKIYTMNTIMGYQPSKPNTDEFWTKIRNQAELVVEETSEALDAIIEQDPAQVLGEVSDIMVTALGLYQKLIASGYPIEEALHRVCDKNLEKFHSTDAEANETVKFYQDQGIETFVRLIVMEDGSEYYSVIQKGSNKMLKPKGLQKVTFDDLVEKIENIHDIWDKVSENEA